MLRDFLHTYWLPAFEWCAGRAEDRDKCLNHFPQGAYSLEKELHGKTERYATHPNTSSCDSRFFKIQLPGKEGGFTKALPCYSKMYSLKKKKKLGIPW